MKRLWLTLAFLALGCVYPAVAHAQLTYPLPATVAWDAPTTTADPTQAITGYTVTYNGISTTLAVTAACTLAECTAKISIPDAASHSVSVVSVNLWGQSTPVGFSFAAAAPGKSTNVKIRTP